jgi:UDP-N-acetyl-D-mannosaminuronate dehydrogenase
VKAKAIVVGLGETGMPLWQVLDAAYPKEILGFDPKKDGFRDMPGAKVEILNVCIPWGPEFVEHVNSLRGSFQPELTVIHSTVPVGTTSQFLDAVHSPILGRHGRMREELLTYTKWIGGEKAEMAAAFFEKARIRCQKVEKPEETELMKLMCLAKFGASIAFAFYQKSLCDKFGIKYEHVLDWDRNHNEGVYPSFKRPLIEPDETGKIRGHCVVPGARILNEQFPNPMVEEILKYG